jgi:hypothetical protein
MWILLKKRANSGCFPIRKHTGYACSKFIFKYIFHLLLIDDIYFNFILLERLICIKWTMFKHFQKTAEKVVFMMSQCYETMNNRPSFLFRYIWHIHVAYFPIIQIKLLSSHILNTENVRACLCTQSYLVNFNISSPF